MWAAALVVAVLAQVALLTAGEQEFPEFTNDFAVEIDGDDSVADLVAGIHGCRIKRELNQLGNVYIFKHPQVKARHKRSAEDVLRKLKSDPNVKYAEQQKLLKREKRGSLRGRYAWPSARRSHPDADYERARRVIVHDKQIELPIRHYSDPSVYQRYNHDNDPIRLRDFSDRNAGCRVDFKDPFYSDMWYLDNRGQSGGPVGYDVNVQCVWKQGITGKGVVVTILDDGLDHTHPDLQQNYDPKASNNLNDPEGKSHDPTPNLKDPSNTHGTRCAGEVAAQANNSVCGVGIAFNAKIGGVRLLDGPVTDALEAEALLFNNDYIDIYSASWGPTDNGKSMEGPSRLCKNALKTGAEKGRGGRGSLFVWATGNGGMYQDTCSCDGYVSSIYTLSVGCISDEGLSTYFTELCPSTMAVIFTGGAHNIPGEVAERNPKIKVVTTDPIDGCTLEFQGTSSAAPLAAGCFALVLEANPNLTWRDVQHIVVLTARIPTGREDGWMLNGAGHHVNPRFGFGALDCGKMVEMAQHWTTVPEQHVCLVPADKKESELEPEGTIRRTIRTSGCHGDPEHEVNYLEHVEVHVKLEAKYRGDINMFLVSPMGMRSEILRLRPLDDNTHGIDFTFMTVMAWGEDPAGDWQLEVHHKPPSNSHRLSDSGKLLEWNLTLYGTAKEPTYRNRASIEARESARRKKAHSMNEVDLKHTIADEEQRSDHLAIRKESEGKGDSSDVNVNTQREEEETDHGSRRRAQEAEDVDNLLSLLQNILDDDQRKNY